MDFFLGLCCFLFFSVVASSMEIPLSSCPDQIKNISKVLRSSAIHLPLHHPQSPCSPAPLPGNLFFSEILRDDVRRVAALSIRIAPSTTAAAAAAVSVPLSPGTAIGVGNYITQIGLGTPSKSFVVVVDTGSSLPWVQCLPCTACHKQSGPLFDPSASSTYRQIPCSSSSCSAVSSATLNPSSCSSSGSCIYEASYGDGSFSVGYLSQEKISLHGTIAHLLIFGCGQFNEGLYGLSAGIVGLSKNSLSLLYQLAPSLGSSFSYCLPTTASTGYLSLGSQNPAGFVFTPMVKSSLEKSLYFLELADIKVAGRSLSVPASAYTDTPTIIDSGTVITRLPEKVYSALSGAVVAAVGGRRPRVAPYYILDTCFKGTAEAFPAPEVALLFAGGAVMRLSTRNVLIDMHGGTTCLAFAAAKGVGIIGNRLQQTFKVLYDVEKERIGFAAGGCG